MIDTSQLYARNATLTGLRCLRCEKVFPTTDPVVDQGIGCPSCLAQDFPVSLVCAYENDGTAFTDGTRRRMLRFSRHLPYTLFPTLGEGDTPLVHLPKVAQSLGVRNVWMKNEGQNPTGSHKDRMSGLVVARALDAGYKTVVAASSGNAGASLAAYAAAAGMECVIVAMSSISPMWEAAIEFHGAELHTRQGQDDRWRYMQEMVEKKGCYPATNYISPPISSNPFGVEGYKTLAYELAEELEGVTPLVVLVPTCRGDVLAGICYGFLEALAHGMIHELPRLIAVEPGERLTRVIEGTDYRSRLSIEPHHLSSIGGDTATYQSLSALKKTNGTAVAVTTRQTVAAQKSLATNGLYVELSSAAALSGAEQLAKSAYLKEDDNLVLIGTSHGYKELPQKPAWAI